MGMAFAVQMITMIIVFGILTAIVVPNYTSWLPKSRVNGAARELLTEARLARMKAISEDNNYVVTFNTTDNSYRIYDDDDSDFKTAGVEAEPITGGTGKGRSQ